MRYIKYCLLQLLLFISSNLFSQSNHYSRVIVKANPDSLYRWSDADFFPAHFSYRNGMLEMELNASEMDALKKTGISYTDISKEFYKGQSITSPEANQRVTRSQFAPTYYTHGSMGGYHTYNEAMDVLDEMRLRYPTLVSLKDTIGVTYEGRPIVTVRISDNPDNYEKSEDEWLITALHHANEVMGEEVVFYFVWFLLENYQTDKEIRDLLNNSALHIIPVVNPDGLAYNEITNPSGGGGWRKNRKPRVVSSITHYGVDLNRNYGFKRAYTHPGQLGQAGSSFAGNDYYRGTAAWSEAETSALREFCKKHEFTAAFNYHAWDDSFNYPWNFDVDSLTTDSTRYKAIAAYCTADNFFEKGTFNRTLGYTANGTSDDWLYGEQIEKNKIFAFTIEVGKSFWPSPGLIDIYCDSLLQANLKMMRMAARYTSAAVTGKDTVLGLSNYVSYTLSRYSIIDTTFTVSITPLDAAVASTAAPKMYADLSFLETKNDTLDYLLSATITDGTVFRLLLTIDNGKWKITDTIVRVYKNTGTLAIDCHTEASKGYSQATAIRIYNNVPVSAAIESKGEENWFWFENKESQRCIRFVLSYLPEDYDIALFDAAGKQLAVSERPYKLNDTLVFNANWTGRFMVRVYGYKQKYRPFRCYSLALTLAQEPYPSRSFLPSKNENQSLFVFSIYPQPAANHASVNIQSSIQQLIEWSLFDNVGRKLTSGFRRVPKGQSSFTIDLTGIPPDLYRLQLLLENGTMQTATIVRN